MKRSQFLLLQLLTVALLPIWIGFGRLFFGAGGWLIIVSIVITPVLLGLLAFLWVITFARRDIKVAGRVGSVELVLWLALIISGLVLGFTVVDGGDTEESVKSAFTAIVGQNYNGLSDSIAQIAESIFALSGVVFFIYSVAMIIKYHRVKQ